MADDFSHEAQAKRLYGLGKMRRLVRFFASEGARSKATASCKRAIAPRHPFPGSFSCACALRSVNLNAPYGDPEADF
jgi:hypothetical protein